MRPKRDPIPRAREPWVWLGGVALLGVLGAGVTGAAVLLWENIDIRQLAPGLAAAPPRAPQPDDPIAPVHPDVSFGAVLFDAERNRTFYPDTTFYRAELEVWSELVTEVGGTVRRAGQAADLQGLSPSDVLLLVEAPCLSDGEIAAVRAHLRRGGGVVANWAVGARDAECAWRGWTTTAELTGAEDVREIPPSNGLFLSIPGGVALSPGFDPGARIELLGQSSLALRLSGPRVYWSDWSLNPAPDESGGGADVAAVATYSPYGGRVAWYGLRMGQAARPPDATRLRRLAQNGVLWAAGVPLAAPAPWPEGRRAALMIVLDVEDEPRNAIGVAELLQRRGVPGTFFVVSQLVEGDGDLGAALASTVEVGSQTSDHTPVAGLTARDQTMRLRRSWLDVEAWIGAGPTGLHPPEEGFDLNTLSAWAAAGGQYVLASNEARSASPELHQTEEGAVVLIPRLLKDDYNIIVQDRVLRAAGLGAAFLEGTRKLRAIGGLAVVAGHTQILRPGARLDALDALVDSLEAQGDWWIASGGDVATWWSARAATRVRFAPASDPSAAELRDLVVEAPADVGTADLWIDVVVPSGTDGLYPLVDGLPVDFVVTEWGVRVPVGTLEAGEARRITLRRDGGTGPAPLPR